MTLLEKDFWTLLEKSDTAETEEEKNMYDVYIDYLLPYLKNIKGFKNFDMPLILEDTADEEDICYIPIQIKEFNKKLIKHIPPKINIPTDEFYFPKEYYLKEVRNIILDFYSHFDPILYKFIKECMDNEHLHILNQLIDEEVDGMCLHINPLNHTHIFVCKNGKWSVEEMAVLAHELGHAIHLRGKRSFEEETDITSSSLSEMPSKLFEELFIKFLINNQVEHAKKVDFMWLRELKMQLLSFSKMNINQYSKYWDYIYGSILSHYYSKKYENDPEITKKNIYDFIKHIGFMCDMDMFENFGINKEELIRGEYLKTKLPRGKK